MNTVQPQTIQQIKYQVDMQPTTAFCTLYGIKNRGNKPLPLHRLRSEWATQIKIVLSQIRESIRYK